MEILSFIQTYILIPQADAAISEEFVAFIGRVNQHVVNPLIVVLFSVALVLFIVGLYKFFSGKDNADALKTGKQHMLWGIIGMAIMVSVFGIMNFITGSLGIDDVDPSSSGDFSGLQRDTQSPVFRP
ncbi:hypothetical protein KC929_01190 [Patescibacteria group bacterium]|nr:hypothetical protein [Patescibacteria group bacterium]